MFDDASTHLIRKSVIDPLAVASFESVTGYSAEERSKMHGPEFFVGADKDLITGRIKSAFLEGAADAEAELVTKDGRKIPHYLTGLRNMLDGRAHLLSMGIDITYPSANSCPEPENTRKATPSEILRR